MTCMHVRVGKCVRACVRACEDACVHAYARVYLRFRRHLRCEGTVYIMFLPLNVFGFKCMHACIRTHIHTHVHTYMHTNIYYFFRETNTFDVIDLRLLSCYSNLILCF